MVAITVGEFKENLPTVRDIATRFMFRGSYPLSVRLHWTIVGNVAAGLSVNLTFPSMNG